MNIKVLFSILFLSISTISFSQDTTDSILEEAYEQAKTENKNVLIVFQASWCSWCKKLDQNLNNENIKAMFESNYVIKHLTVNESKDKKHLETPGGGLFLKRYNGAKAGLPFWLIFDKNRSLLGNSFGSDGKNMGSPSTKQEVEDFINTLKKTSTLTDEELAEIAKVFYIEKK